MTKLFAAALLIFPLVTQFAAPLAAQKKSPHETVSGNIGGAHITITYGRPYLKGRSLASLTPGGQVWRLGADEATTLTTDRNIMIGSLAVPAGTYALFALPNGMDWKLIVNKKATQWGLDHEENKASDLGQTDLMVSQASTPVEQLTISVGSGKLHIMWGNIVAEAAILEK